MSSDYDYQLISNVAYLNGYYLLINFQDGTSRIVDILPSFEVPATRKYFPIEIFKSFGFDRFSVWWGDHDSDCWEIGYDSLYRMSVEVSEYLSALSTKAKLLSMVTVFHEKEPYNVLGRVLGGDYDRPHIRITYNDVDYIVRLDDVYLVSPDNLVSVKTKRFIIKYASKYRQVAMDCWIDRQNQIAIQEAKEKNWPWWDEDGFPAPDPAELARASDYGDPFPFDEFADDEDPVDA